MSAEALQKHLSYVALDRLPTPGFAVKGWLLTPQASVSSFKEGVKVTGYNGERIQLEINAKFYGVSGQNVGPDCGEPPADAPMDPRCFFVVREAFTGHITVDLSIFSDP